MSLAQAHAAIDDIEWKARVDLAALYRAVHIYGMTDLIYNHITARVPGTEHVLLNPFGLMYDEITASSLYLIDFEGEVIRAPDLDYGLNRTGFVIHGAIHAARPDLAVIIHTHSRAGTAVSAMKCGLLPISQQAALIDGTVAYHGFEGPAFDLAERERLVSDLGPHNLMILRNHGLIACGATVAEAFLNLHRLESACKVQVDAMSGGQANILDIEPTALEATSEAMRLYAPADPGALEWAAVMRRLDRIDTSYQS